jgi:hypothetical protein
VKQSFPAIKGLIHCAMDLRVRPPSRLLVFTH